jgi:hypothetical protein
LEKGFETPEYRWTAMLNPAEKTAKKTAAKSKATTTKSAK